MSGFRTPLEKEIAKLSHCHLLVRPNRDTGPLDDTALLCQQGMPNALGEVLWGKTPPSFPGVGTYPHSFNEEPPTSSLGLQYNP